jgi:hypothetical protein
MSMENMGALVARGVGIGLIVMAVCSMLWWPLGGASSGWTSYSPTSTKNDPVTTLQDTYYSILSVTTLFLPSLAQIAAGAVMIFLSRPVGRWLARGLDEKDGG